MLKHRMYNEMYARAHGYFWESCPSCGEFFCGHEWKNIDGHSSTIPEWLAGEGE